MSELLLKRNYEVLGVVSIKRAARHLGHLEDNPHFRKLAVDFSDSDQISKMLNEFEPDELYNLIAASSVKESFENPYESALITGLTPVRILESIRISKFKNSLRFYQASSSEMYGNGPSLMKDENSEFLPSSPYAISKVFAHQTCSMYRDVHGLFVSCGILFNHESTLRSEQFVTRKITREVARIFVGKKDKMMLGALHPQRDWGYAGDYVNAMWLMLQHNSPEDFVIATGKTNSILEFASIALKSVGLNNDPMNYIETSDSLKRPFEIAGNAGNAGKAKKILGWEPTMSLNDLIRNMVEFDIQIELKSSAR